jgi:hypothetical protein
MATNGEWAHSKRMDVMLKATQPAGVASWRTVLLLVAIGIFHHVEDEALTRISREEAKQRCKHRDVMKADLRY